MVGWLSFRGSVRLQTQASCWSASEIIASNCNLVGSASALNISEIEAAVALARGSLPDAGAQSIRVSGILVTFCSPLT